MAKQESHQKKTFVTVTELRDCVEALIRCHYVGGKAGILTKGERKKVMLAIVVDGLRVYGKTKDGIDQTVALLHTWNTNNKGHAFPHKKVETYFPGYVKWIAKGDFRVSCRRHLQDFCVLRFGRQLCNFKSKVKKGLRGNVAVSALVGPELGAEYEQWEQHLKNEHGLMGFIAVEALRLFSVYERRFGPSLEGVAVSYERLRLDLELCRGKKGKLYTDAKGSKRVLVSETRMRAHRVCKLLIEEGLLEKVSSGEFRRGGKATRWRLVKPVPKCEIGGYWRGRHWHVT
jgi:hypothetical protein